MGSIPGPDGGINRGNRQLAAETRASCAKALLYKTLHFTRAGFRKFADRYASERICLRGDGEQEGSVWGGA